MVEFSPNLVTLVVIVFVENCEICLEMAKTVTQTKVKYYTHTNLDVTAWLGNILLNCYLYLDYHFLRGHKLVSEDEKKNLLKKN